MFIVYLIEIWDVRIPTVASWGWRKLLLLRDGIQWHFRSKIGNGLQTSAWFDNWSDLGPFINWVTRREIASAGFELSCKVADLCNSQGWKWPAAWSEKYPTLNLIPLPKTNVPAVDKIV